MDDHVKAAEVDGLQVAQQGMLVMVEVVAEGQGVQVRWKNHVLQALVERRAKGQVPQAARQCHTFQSLVELIPEGQ